MAEEEKKFIAPGSFVIGVVFMIMFVLFYFLNWKWLSMAWEVGKR